MGLGAAGKLLKRSSCVNSSSHSQSQASFKIFFLFGNALYLLNFTTTKFPAVVIAAFELRNQELRWLSPTPPRGSWDHQENATLLQNF